MKFGMNAEFTKFLVYTQTIVELLLNDNLLFENHISTFLLTSHAHLFVKI